MRCRASTSPSHTKKILLRQPHLAQFQSTVAVWRGLTAAPEGCYKPLMILPAPLIETLGSVAAIMEKAREPWWIIASAAAALHGASPITVADADVLLGVEDAHRLLPVLGIEPYQGPPNSLFRSQILAKWSAPPVPVDLMAGFEHRIDDAWHPVQPVTRQAITIGTATVYVPERDELRRIIEGFGRPKDLERARLLAELTSPP